MDLEVPASHNGSLKENYLPFLDGLRGLAAVWVIASHSLYLTSSHIKYVARGDIAVDSFMILSGFLMAYHYYLREDKEPWGEPVTWCKFYIRRFFRIAPLYYLLLAVFFVMGPLFADWRNGLGAIYNDTWTNPVRFLDHSLQNIFLHVSFLFGLLKDYAVRTVMPDWSITLEMQFYLAFPFLMLTFRRYYFILAVPVLYAMAYQCNAFLYHNGYQKSSVLPMGLHFFLIGMLLALFNRFRKERLKAGCALVLACWLAWITQERFVMLWVGMLIIFLNVSSIGKPFAGMIQMLGSGLATWLADMSYAAYLLHMGFMMPIAYVCAQNDFFRALPDFFRFLTVFVLTLIATYSTAPFLFHWIEKKGIAWGKKIVKRLATG